MNNDYRFGKEIRERFNLSRTIMLYNMTVVFIALFVVIATNPLHAQQPVSQKQNTKITFVGIDASKEYPNGNQITYVLAKGLPTNKATIKELQDHIIATMRVSRISITPQHGYFMFDGDADINPQHIVDEMNSHLQMLSNQKNEDKEKSN